jgi:hypothetical protein
MTAALGLAPQARLAPPGTSHGEARATGASFGIRLRFRERPCMAPSVAHAQSGAVELLVSPVVGLARQRAGAWGKCLCAPCRCPAVQLASRPLREVHCSLLAREKRGLDTHPRQLIHHTSGSVSTRYTEIHAPKELLNARSVAGRISIAALVRAGSGGRASAVDQAVRG